MLSRQNLATVLVVAATLVFAGCTQTGSARASDPSGEAPRLQLAAGPTHAVTINVMVNNGDVANAKKVAMVIEPAAGNKNKDARATLTGPGTVQLPTGSYKIVATLDGLRLEDRLQVGGPTTHTLTVKAGYATLKWIDKIGGRAVQNDVKWDILTYRKVNGQRQLIISLVGAQPRIALPEGWYIAEATYKGKTKRLAIDIANGLQFDYVLCGSC